MTTTEKDTKYIRLLSVPNAHTLFCDEAGSLYIVDRSGVKPDSTEDGPAVVQCPAPDPLHGRAFVSYDALRWDVDVYLSKSDTYATVSVGQTTAARLSELMGIPLVIQRDGIRFVRSKDQRKELIKAFALSYLKSNLDDVRATWVTEPYEHGMMNFCGTAMPAITEEELEKLIACDE